MIVTAYPPVFAVCIEMVLAWRVTITTPVTEPEGIYSNIEL